MIFPSRFAPLLLVLLLTLAGDASPPNVVVILTDDQGWGDLGMNGNTNLSTPNIDRLAREGAHFERFYVCPVCSPTRAEFLTGRYHPRGGVYSTSAGGERLDLDEVTIADTFRAAGYATGAFGKWHNGMQHPYHPNGRGFEEFYGFCSGHWGNYFSPPLEHNGRIVQGDGFVIDDFTTRAMAFIEKSVKRGRPFFAYLPYNTPHSPMQVPDRWWKKFREKEVAMRNRNPKKENAGHIRAALAMCENIDWNVGRLTNHLDKLGIARETIVIYFCDNGPNGVRWNGDMLGRKGSTDEGGVRSPMIIRWPGTIAAGKLVRENGAAIDLLPTLADLAGIGGRSAEPLDGVSLKPVITGGAERLPEERLIFSHWNGKVSVKSGPHRLANDGRLYDLESDPGQRTDLSGKMPELAQRLRKAVVDWRAELLPGFGEDDRPFVIGHPGAEYTQVPARDGTAHGNIRRSNKFPNCSFFHSWASTDDYISWKAEVVESGTFEVDLHYTCPPEAVGTVLELSFRGKALRKTITETHDPPLRGASEDRVERMESYVKDFKAVPMGKIRLEKGPGELELRAVEVPGGRAIDFRLLMLRRVGD